LDLLGPFTLTIGQLKHLTVTVDYYTKWIELEPLASIASVKAQNFVFRQIICRFSIPAEVICDNGTEFTNKNFREMLAGLHIKQYFSSVEHPQSNGQAESTNKVILNGLKKRLEKAGTNWVEDLYQILWSYRTTPRSTTRETPFQMVYRLDVVIPVEIG
jgi:transposase InsO family protein